jgi:hypothetical protein
MREHVDTIMTHLKDRDLLKQQKEEAKIQKINDLMASKGFNPNPKLDLFEQFTQKNEQFAKK